MTTNLEDAQTLRTVLCGLNGQPIGQTLSADQGAALRNAGLRLPLTAVARGLFPTSENTAPPGAARPTERGALPMPWSATPTALIPLWMFTPDGRPAETDPRHALAAVVARYARQGWTPRVGAQMTFALASATPGVEILAPETLAQLDHVLSDIFDGAAKMGIEAEPIRPGAEPGQFRAILKSQDTMNTADDLWLLKMLIKGMATRHGLHATFALPELADTLRLSFSVMTEEEENIFNDLNDEGASALSSALAGGIQALPLLFTVTAPFSDGYRDLASHYAAGDAVSYGRGPRTAPLHVPSGPAFARRIACSVPRASANPYIALAILLGAAWHGLTTGATLPAKPLCPQMPLNLSAALTQTAGAGRNTPLPKALIAAYRSLKMQDLAALKTLSPEARAQRLAQLI